MPYFNTQPSSNLAASLRKAIGGGAGLSASDLSAIDGKAADTAYKMTLADKARAEMAAAERETRMRSDPDLAAEYASNVAGLDIPTGQRLSRSLRGQMEQPGPADMEDAAMVGAEAQPFRVTAPEVAPVQRQRFQGALAALAANTLATGKTNAQQIAQAQGELQGQGITDAVQAAIAGGDPQRASAMNQGGKLGNQIKLYDNVGTTGATFAPATGAVNAEPKGNALLTGTINKVLSEIRENDAQAGNASASAARTRDAMTREKRGVYDPARGILVDPITGQAREIMGADGKPIGSRAPGGPAFKDVTTLRKEFNDQKEVVAFRDVIPIIESARATPDSRAGDIQIAYAVGKILDPASVVREGELQLVGNAATLPEKLQGEMRTLVMGKGRMTPETRAALLQMLDVAVTQRENAYMAAENTYRGIARQNGFPEDQVIINAPRRNMTPKKPEATKSVGGKNYVKVDGKWFEQ